MKLSESNRQLIINADDFGWDEDTCKATIECMELGTVRSATIMTGRPASAMACDYADRNVHRFSFGLHFNIVDEHVPLCRDLRTLVDRRTGTFPASGHQRLKALRWGFDGLEVQRELRAQLHVLKQYGVRVSHLDSHGHLHKFPSMIKAIDPVLRSLGILRVRRPQNIYGPGASLITRGINAICTPSFAQLRTTDHLLTVTSYADSWFRALLAMLPIGSTELAIHPGRIEKWRSQELAPLLHTDFHEWISNNRITLTDFSAIR